MYKLEFDYGTKLSTYREMFLPVFVCGSDLHREPSLLQKYADKPGYRIVTCVDLRKPEPAPDLSYCDSAAEYFGGGYNID